MAGMKKSTTKKRSARAIEQEQQRIAEETAAKEAAEKRVIKRKKLMEESKKIMFAMYGLVFAVISWLVDWMGIVAIISIILSAFGLHYTDRKTTPKYYWMAVGGIALGGARLLFTIVYIIRYFMA